MKAAGKQTTMLFIVLIVMLLFLYFVLLYGPQSNTLADKEVERNQVSADLKAINARIAAGEGLNEEIESYKVLISEYEKKLLPQIETQVIAQILQDKFIEHGIPFITKSSTEPPQESRVLLPDGTDVSDAFLNAVTFNIQVCGTDGIHKSILDDPDLVVPDDLNLLLEEELLPFTIVGYEEFMKAVKDVENDLPDSIKLQSFLIEESGQGFMYYSIAVVAYSMDLPNRISEPARSGPYVTWDGVPTNQIPREGLVGVPYYLIPESKRSDNLYLPFAIYEGPEVAPALPVTEESEP